MSEKFDKKLAEYAATFNDIFPTFQAPEDEAEIIAIIDNAIKTGKPYEPEVKDGVLY